MILADRKKLKTPNGMILGTPGSGGLSAKRSIVGVFLNTKDRYPDLRPGGRIFSAGEPVGRPGV